MAKKYECPSDHAYNHMTKMCDWRFNVDCSRREQPTTKVSQTTTMPTTTTSSSTTTTNSLTNENITTVISSLTTTTISSTTTPTMFNLTTINFQPDNNSTGNSSNKIICQFFLQPVLNFSMFCFDLILFMLLNTRFSTLVVI